MPQSQTVKTMGAELVGDAKSIGGKAADRLHSEVDSRKASAAEHAKTVSNAIGRVTEDLDPQTPTWLRSGIEQGAAQVQKLAQALEQKDSRQLMRDVTAFARTSPGTFLGVCAAAGFAAARVFQAGGQSGMSPPFDPSKTDIVDQQTAAADAQFDLSANRALAGGTQI